MAPEALAKSPKQINTKASDMWSFAILLWEMATREAPFPELSPMEAGIKVGFSLEEVSVAHFKILENRIGHRKTFL